MSEANVLDAALSWALEGVEVHRQCHYSEGADRWGWVKVAPDHLPWFGDCSSRYTFCWWAGGGRDPNQMDFTGGFTGTLIAHGTEVAEADLRPMDAVIYFDNEACVGTGVHVAAFYKRTPRGLLTISMGEEGDPSLVYVGPLGDTRPHKFYRYDARLRPDLSAPVYAPGHVPAPTPVPTSPAPVQPPFKAIRAWARDPRVQQVRGKLGVKGNNVYGPVLQAKVRRFKSARLLTPGDATVTEATWKALGLP